MNKGGYDKGYKKCPCFWGTSPSSLVLKLDEFISDYKSLKVLDLGCGEGKNSIYLAGKGCEVEAYDISDYAIKNFYAICPSDLNIRIKQADVLKLNLEPDKYDIIIAYGLFHCFKSRADIIKMINSALISLKKNGFFVVCAFNSRQHDLSAHPGFNPVLLPHSEYLDEFKFHKILFESDQDLFETHPNNHIPHSHSMSRILILKQNGFPSGT